MVAPGRQDQAEGCRDAPARGSRDAALPGSSDATSARYILRARGDLAAWRDSWRHDVDLLWTSLDERCE